MRGFVETTTGRGTVSFPQKVQDILGAVHVAGTLTLLPRAMWSSLAEPITLYSRTGDMGVNFRASGNLFREIVGGADVQQRAELARALGVVTSSFYDTSSPTGSRATTGTARAPTCSCPTSSGARA
ncbi:hypothetical protein [Roseomonas sp. BN140053]|uniref:hypothetical protein n=1 Tax=Roseomonas sp. BN140053 TaxID=3391898 RepID=UPI0039E9E5FB